MRVVFSLLATAILTSSAWAGVTAGIFLADEETPLSLRDPNIPDVYRDIMVGTRLTILIESDQPGYWLGSLLIPWGPRDRGLVSGRGPSVDGGLLNFWGSCREAAGEDAGAWHAYGPSGEGVEFSSDWDAGPGEWFMFDYYAERIGTCDVGFYAYDWNDPASLLHPIRVLSLAHVPSRDFDADTTVNFKDFGNLASQWGRMALPDPSEDPCPSVDLNADGLVSACDMALFGEFWLKRTDFNEPNGNPNAPTSTP